MNKYEQALRWMEHMTAGSSCQSEPEKIIKDSLFVAEQAKLMAEAQAKDEGLWFQAQTAPEAYLQKALRRLHHVVEGDCKYDYFKEEK